MSQTDPAAVFRALHDRRPLVLPNAWDAATARVIEGAGAPAIATTSAAVAWALGRADGERVTRDDMVAAVRRIAAAVRVPVTADVEGGYGAGLPADVAATVRAVVGVGAVGVNLEDAPGRDGAVLLDAERQAERIRAAREAARAEGVDVFVNARTDVYLAGFGAPEGRLEETLRRAAIYREAGADGLFVPGVRDAETIAALAAGAGLPLNVMSGPGAPTVADLGALGVARVSVGPALALAALERVRAGAAELLTEGTYGALSPALGFGEANPVEARS